jgi:hypothetical protein
MVDLTVIRDLVAIAGVLIALAYHVINIQHQRETHTRRREEQRPDTRVIENKGWDEDGEL